MNQDNNSFTSLELDPETETYHAQFRQYGPAQGSWMSPDPYSGSYDMNNPQSLNRYSYVLNNPLAFTDRSGLFTCGTACDPDPDPCGEDPGSNCPVNAGDPNPPTFTVNTWYFDPCDIDWIYCSGPAGPGCPTPGPPNLPTLSSAPSNPSLTKGSKSAKQKLCEDNLFGAAIAQGIGSAVGIGVPGSDPTGDIASAAKNAASSPAVRATAGVMAAQLGSALLTRAGAARLGALISEEFVPGLGWAAGAYIGYSAFRDAMSYYDNNVASCSE